MGRSAHGDLAIWDLPREGGPGLAADACLPSLLMCVWKRMRCSTEPPDTASAALGPLPPPSLMYCLQPQSTPLPPTPNLPLQVLEHPQADTVAFPLDDNLFVWHANLRLRRPEEDSVEAPAPAAAAGRLVARLVGIPIHAILIFPDTYPTDGPEIRVFHSLPHPNVSPHLAPLE